MSKVLCIITIPDDKGVVIDARTVIQHPAMQDIDGKMLKIVRVDTVVVSDRVLKTVDGAYLPMYVISKAGA